MSSVERRTGAGGERLVRNWDATGDAWAALLIVHGLGEHSGRYERTGTLLAQAGVTVRSFDLPGFGESAGRRGHIDEFDEYVNAVEQELGELRTTGLPVFLLGHSLGGLIAYRYAHSDRPAPDFLILSAPALGANAPAWQRRLAPVLGRLAPTVSIPNPIKGEQLSRDAAVGEAYFADPLVHTSATARLGAEIFAAIDEASPAAAPPIPTYVIHGGSDSLVPPGSSAALGDMPGVERRLYPSLRHECFNEPEGPSVVDDLVAWMRGQVDAAAASE